MRQPDLDIAVEWASREGWNPGLHDAEIFYHADPSGFFAGFISEIQVACISSTAYGSSFGFLGLYIVRPEYRRRKLGIKIWEKALEYLGNRNIGRDGVITRQADYEKYDFKFAYRNLRFAGSIGCRKNSKNIVDLKSFEASEIAEYDSQMFPTRRDNFISRWVRHEGSKALGYLEDSRLAGYGVLRPCITGFKVGPLFADSKEIAQDLLSGLASNVGKDKIFIDVPEPNRQAIDLVESNGMVKVFETARMYNRAIPDLPLDRIYGVTTLELG
jgi:ribosomal protein S18 acetylase RimI-like enzyme